MSPIHPTPFARAGQTVRLKDGSELRIEDYWERVYGKSWQDSDGNPAVYHYALRAAGTGLPLDNEVVYGKDARNIGHLVHVNELAEVKS